jgi:hypothetical protein
MGPGARAKAGDRWAITSYLAKNVQFSEAMGKYALAYVRLVAGV